MKNKIIELARANGADIVKFAPVERFEKNSPVLKIMPETKTVIGLAFRVLRGIYRGIEEGSTYYQYTTMGVENMEETIMPMAQMRISTLLEEEGFTAIPQRRHQQIMAESDSTNHEVDYRSVYRGKSEETQLDFLDTAIKCGLGEKGLGGMLLTDDFGPMVRYCFVLTDAKIEEDSVIQPHLCDNCGECQMACPGKAIDKDGNVDEWQCTVYYNGANGRKNPFMPPDAFNDLDNRIEIIAGEAKVSPETARKILDRIYFYPPAQHAYQCSICGRACDMACYSHLEQKGVLSKKFNKPFKRRKDWEFDISDFE